MAISLYRISVPVMVRGFGVLRTYMDKAEAFANERGQPSADLVQTRLAADMLPLAGQVQRASDAAKGGVARLANTQAPSFPDVETTVDELRQRIDRTVEFLRSLRAEDIDGNEDLPIDLKLRGVKNTLRAEDYVLEVVIPNFFFHVTTAHDILRHQGLKIGKRDYLGHFD